MTHTGDDIEQVSPVTTILLQGVNDLLIKSKVGPIIEQKDQQFSDTNPTTSLCPGVLCLYLHAVRFG